MYIANLPQPTAAMPGPLRCAVLCCALVTQQLAGGCANNSTVPTRAERAQARHIIAVEQRLRSLEEDYNRQTLRLAWTEEQLREIENRRRRFAQSLAHAAQAPLTGETDTEGEPSPAESAPAPTKFAKRAPANPAPAPAQTEPAAPELDAVEKKAGWLKQLAGQPLPKPRHGYPKARQDPPVVVAYTETGSAQYDVLVEVHNETQLRQLQALLDKRKLKDYFVVDQPKNKRIYFGAFTDPASANLRKDEVQRILRRPALVRVHAVKRKN